MFLIFGVFNETNYKRPNCNVLQSVKRMVCGLCGLCEINGIIQYGTRYSDNDLWKSQLHAKDIAESCFLPKQTVNAVVTSFLKDGWVQLEELPSDRRNKTVNLTAEGLAKAREIMDKVHSCEITAMSQLTEDERDTLLKLTKTYIHKCSQAMAENIE